MRIIELSLYCAENKIFPLEFTASRAFVKRLSNASCNFIGSPDIFGRFESIREVSSIELSLNVVAKDKISLLKKSVE